MTAPATTTRTNEITIGMTGRELRQFLGAVLPHASTDDSLPVLTMVTFEATGDMLHALATDRYTLAIARHPLPDPAPDKVTLTVPAAALGAVLRQIKVRADVRLTLTSDGLTLDQLSDPRLTYRLHATGEAPLLADWRNWIANRLTAKPEPVVTSARGVALNPDYLARFRAASRDHLPLEIRPAGRCMVITCGTHFLGLVTPMDLTKMSEYSTDPLTGWLSTPPADTNAA
ncbi:hypothetical protein GCM10010149_23630 [Nonomuraea roseoviolacea subsp. roseoviolacea]|uniref:DNA polymerase III subunit beta family protein n=1 Tax=Nonomuraea roseoviolacea TaxID=103837 RepID=UPI0031E13683